MLEEKKTEINTAALRLANIYRIRTGRVPALITEIVKMTGPAVSPGKFNPYHDELGRFTFAPGGGTAPEGPPKIPRQRSVTVNSPTQIIIHRPDGTDEIRTGGDKNWRNNNPGNLVYGDFAVRHGAIGSNNGFAVFPDEQTGYDASEALLNSPGYSSLTINQAIANRSPGTENNTPLLQRQIPQEAGLSGMRTIGSLNDEEMSRLLDVLHRHEGGKEGTVVMTSSQ